ncbi:MAG: GIY-YIG nuclease family protein [Alphaproteobacteria bacterium PRO2]|nr:GIY-YIG nuclease family protein [Alphaproteobacteria bacterium PRO2]
MSWTVYILQCADGTLYTGVTNDLDARLKKHTDGTGAKYTRGRGPFKLLLSEAYPSRGAAQTREAKIKALKKEQKMAIIAQKRRKKAVP